MCSNPTQVLTLWLLLDIHAATGRICEERVGAPGLPVEEESIRLREASQQWYRKFYSFMTDQGYHKSQAEYCVFVKKFDGGDLLILVLYVDDMQIVGRDQV